jgi:integrase
MSLTNDRALEPADGRALQPQKPTPLTLAGRVANRVAGSYVFERYLSEKSQNTLKRHGRDLELFAEYLIDAGIRLEEGDGADFQHNPHAWRGVTWGIVEGFVRWLLAEGYAVASVNSRLSVVRTYAHLAVKAGAISREEGMLIQAVKGFSRAAAANVNEKREQTRVDSVTYDYKPEGKKRRVVVTRQSTKKARPRLLSDDEASDIMQVRNRSPQAWRDALLMCLLLDHGLRASEVTALQVGDIHLGKGELRFRRPKVKGTEHEWAQQELTSRTRELSSYYIEHLYPPTLRPHGPLIVATTRLLKNGEGGELLAEGLNRVRVSERVAYLGRQLGIPKLSAHDCRHTCATKMARLGYSLDELMAWFGWASAQTAMRYVTAVDIKKRYKG